MASNILIKSSPWWIPVRGKWVPFYLIVSFPFLGNLTLFGNGTCHFLCPSFCLLVILLQNIRRLATGWGEKSKDHRGRGQSKRSVIRLSLEDMHWVISKEKPSTLRNTESPSHLIGKADTGLLWTHIPWSPTCQLPTLPSAPLWSSCWRSFLSKQMSLGEFKALSWRPDSDCSLNYVCLHHYAVIHIYFRHQYCLEIFSVLRAIYMLLFFPLLLLWQYASASQSTECPHIISINIFTQEELTIGS